MTDVELVAAAAKLRKLDAKKREVSAQQDSIRTLLRLELDSRNTDTLSAGKLTVHRTSYVRSSIDVKKLREDLPDVFGKYAVPQTVTRIEVLG